MPGGRPCPQVRPEEQSQSQRYKSHRQENEAHPEGRPGNRALEVQSRGSIGGLPQQRLDHAGRRRRGFRSGLGILDGRANLLTQLRVLVLDGRRNLAGDRGGASRAPTVKIAAPRAVAAPGPASGLGKTHIQSASARPPRS